MQPLRTLTAGACLALASLAATTPARAATQTLGLSRVQARVATGLQFSVPADFTQRRSSATGLDLPGQFERDESLPTGERCAVVLGVRPTALTTGRFIHRAPSSFRIGTASMPSLLISPIEQRGRTRDGSGTWYQAPATGSEPSGVAVLRSSRFPKANYGVLVTATVFSYALDADGPASAACDARRQSLSGPLTRRALRNVRLVAPA